MTSSEEYYPTIAINALIRALRDPAMVSHHEPVVKALFTIFGALGLNSVPYLPKARPFFAPCSWSAPCISPIRALLRPLPAMRFCTALETTACPSLESDKFATANWRQIIG